MDSQSVQLAPAKQGQLEYEWSVKAFSKLPSKIGQCHCSAEKTLDVGGVATKWQLELYPLGTTGDDAVLIFIRLVSSSCYPIAVRYSLCAFGEEKQREIVMSESGRRGSRFLSRSALLGGRRKELMPRDTLTVTLSATIAIKGESFGGGVRHRLGGAVQLFRYFNDRHMSDVKIRCVDRGGGGGSKKAIVLSSIKAHRIVLSLFSDEFARLFEATRPCKEVDVEDRPEVVLALVRLMYGGSIGDEELRAHAESLIGLARKYKITPVIELCNRALAKEVEPIADALLADDSGVDLFDADTMKTDVTKSIAGSVTDTVADRGFDVSIVDFIKSSAAEPLADCEIRYNGDACALRAHRVLLAARSPAFKRMFEDSTIVDKVMCGTIDLGDATHAEASLFLKAIYGEQPSEEELGEHGQSLLALAHRFTVDDLKVACETHLCRTVNLANAMRLLVIGSEQCAPRLKSAAIDFIKRHASAIVDEESFDPTLLSRQLAKEIFSAVATS